MLRIIVALGFLFLAGCAATRPQGAAATQFATLTITHVNIVNLETGEILPDRTVLIAADRIVYVGSDRISVPRSARTVSARGQYLIPGLWDMHVHLFRHSPRHSNDPVWFPLFVANGITGIRDMFSDFDDLVRVRELRRQVADGRIGPRLIAGTLVDGNDPVWPGSLVAADPQAGRRVVGEIQAHGADFVKVYSKLSRETYFAIAAEARASGIPFAGHVPEMLRVAEASEAGQRSMEHMRSIERDCSNSDRSIAEWLQVRRLGQWEFYRHLLDEYDPERCRRLFELLARNDTWMGVDPILQWASNLALPRWTSSQNLRFIPGWIQEGWRPGGTRPVPMPEHMALLNRYARLKATIAEGLLRAGVPLFSGTDVGNPFLVPGFSLHENLELLVTEAGFTPTEALRSATINPVRFLGLESSLGSITAGKLADLVLLDANPLADIRNTQRIRAVVLNGRYLDRTALDDLLREAEVAAAQSTRPGAK